MENVSYFSEDIVECKSVGKGKRKGNYTLGVVLKGSQEDSSDDDSDVSDESYEPLTKNTVRVEWHPSGDIKVVDNKKLKLVDRSLIPGDVVRKLEAGEKSQIGYISDARITCLLKCLDRPTLISNVDSSQLELLNKHHDLVYLNTWVGSVKSVQEWVKVKFSDGACCELSKEKDIELLSSFDDINDQNAACSVEFYEGEVLRGKLSTFENANWIVPSVQHCARTCKKNGRKKVTVKIIEVGVVSVKVGWICSGYSKSLDPFGFPTPPPNVITADLLPSLKVLDCYEANNFNLGDKAYLTLRQGARLMSLKPPVTHLKVRKELERYQKRVQELVLKGTTVNVSELDDNAFGEVLKAGVEDWGVDGVEKVAGMSKSCGAREERKGQTVRQTSRQSDSQTQSDSSLSKNEGDALSSSASTQAFTSSNVFNPSIATTADESNTTNASSTPSTPTVTSDHTTTPITAITQTTATSLNSTTGHTTIPTVITTQTTNTDIQTIITDHATTPTATTATTLNAATITTTTTMEPPRDDACTQASPSTPSELMPVKSVKRPHSKGLKVGNRVSKNMKMMTKKMKMKNPDVDAPVQMPQVGQRLPVKIISMLTTVDVVWQDGSTEKDIASVHVVPIHHLNDLEFFPGDYVISNNQKTQDLWDYGVVQWADHQARTCMIRWFSIPPRKNPECPDEEVSVFELKDHPDFNFRPGISVVRVGGFEEEDEGESEGMIKNNEELREQDECETQGGREEEEEENKEKEEKKDKEEAKDKEDTRVTNVVKTKDKEEEEKENEKNEEVEKEEGKRLGKKKEKDLEKREEDKRIEELEKEATKAGEKKVDKEQEGDENKEWMDEEDGESDGEGGEGKKGEAEGGGRRGGTVGGQVVQLRTDGTLMVRWVDGSRSACSPVDLFIVEAEFSELNSSDEDDDDDSYELAGESDASSSSSSSSSLWNSTGSSGWETEDEDDDDNDENFQSNLPGPLIISETDMHLLLASRDFLVSTIAKLQAYMKTLTITQPKHSGTLSDTPTATMPLSATKPSTDSPSLNGSIYLDAPSSPLISSSVDPHVPFVGTSPYPVNASSTPIKPSNPSNNTPTFPIDPSTLPQTLLTNGLPSEEQQTFLISHSSVDQPSPAPIRDSPSKPPTKTTLPPETVPPTVSVKTTTAATEIKAATIIASVTETTAVESTTTETPTTAAMATESSKELDDLRDRLCSVVAGLMFNPPNNTPTPPTDPCTPSQTTATTAAVVTERSKELDDLQNCLCSVVASYKDINAALKHIPRVRELFSQSTAAWKHLKKCIKEKHEAKQLKNDKKEATELTGSSVDGVSDFDTHPLNAKMDLLKQLLCQYDVLLEMLEGDRREGDKRDGSEGVELTLNDELKCHVPSGVESEEVAPSTQGKKEKKEEEEEGSGSDSTISWCSVSEDPQLPSPVPTPADHPPPNAGRQGFVVLETVPENHHFVGSEHRPSNPKLFHSTIKKEMQLLKTCLTEGIFVRSYESRMDLFSVMVCGPVGTPYEGGVFFFDVRLPPDYPSSPPKLHYHSYCSDRLNPNLYEDGKVCVSLLGTWSGKGTEVWNHKHSNLLQVLLSIQGLILNQEPYFNEAGYEKQKGTDQAAEDSRLYNEMALVKLVQSNTKILSTPHAIFQDEIDKHFQETSNSLVCRLQSWIGQETTTSPPCPPPSFPLVPVSKGFKLSLHSALDAFKQAIASKYLSKSAPSA